MGPNNADPCWIFQKYRYDGNSTLKVRLAGGFEGIPELLIINAMAFSVMLFIFAIIRKRVWNYGRIALMKKEEVSIHRTSSYNIMYHLLYGGAEERAAQLDADGEGVGTPGESGMTSGDSGPEGDSQDGGSPRSRPAGQAPPSHRGSLTTGSYHNVDLPHSDQGFCSWLVALFQLSDEHILKKCGPDAVQYSTFQRTLMLYLLIVVIFSIAVVLPVNVQGDMSGDGIQFAHTTISNLDPMSDFLWLHCLLSVFYLGIAVYFMRYFMLNLAELKEDKGTLNTVRIRRIPKSQAGNEDLLKKFFKSAYPEFDTIDVQFAYDIAELIKCSTKWKVAETAYVAIQKSGKNPYIRTRACGLLCPCCCGPKMPAKHYYAEQAQKWRERCIEERKLADDKPLNILFVTFANETQAKRVLYDFARYPMIGVLRHPKCIPLTPFNAQLSPDRWLIEPAVTADDMYWENFAIPWRMVRKFFVNVCLFCLLFFLTTPSMLLSLWYRVGAMMVTGSNPGVTALIPNPIIAQYFPTLMLLVFASVLPMIIFYVEYFSKVHWTRSGQNSTVMKKTFFLLVFMVLILPSLGLMSGRDFILYMFNRGGNFTVRWRCVFLPDNGAFFVNYVTGSAFMACGAELLRIGQLLFYLILISCSRSKWELTYAKWMSLVDFPYGVNYAWTMTIFAIVMAYCLLCPLIAPFGLVYFVIKYYVDRYNLYFAYAPSRIRKSVHRSAISMVLGACVIGQVFLFMFLFVRTGGKRYIGKTIFMLTSIIITVIILAGHIFFGWFSTFSDGLVLSKANLKQKLSAYKRFKDEPVKEEPARSGDDKPVVSSVGTRRSKRSRKMLDASRRAMSLAAAPGVSPWDPRGRFDGGLTTADSVFPEGEEDGATGGSGYGPPGSPTHQQVDDLRRGDVRSGEHRADDRRRASLDIVHEPSSGAVQFVPLEYGGFGGEPAPWQASGGVGSASPSGGGPIMENYGSLDSTKQAAPPQKTPALTLAGFSPVAPSSPSQGRTPPES
jgi:hypothetical protein